MANAYRVDVGDSVSYINGNGRWKSAKVTSVVNPNSLILGIITSTRSIAPLNGGAAVARRTTGTQTNVWRPY